MNNLNPKKLVCIFAHPDDEVFGPGGTIAYFCKMAEVHLICVTNGDADVRFTNGKLMGAELGQVRRDELMKSAEILGIRTVTFLNFHDGTLCNNNYHDVSAKLTKILNKIKPDTLLTFNIDGVTGHLDHVAVAMETSYLFEKLKYVKNLIYFVQNSAVKKILGSKYFVYLPSGFSKDQVDWSHDITPYYKIKLAAMKAHKSQLKDFLLITTLFKKILRVEMFNILTKNKLI